MKIEKIKKLNNGKYKLILEDKEEVITYDDVILSTNILYNKEITDEELKKINSKNDYYDLYNKAIKFISKRLRSEYEVIKYLNKYNSNDINKVIDLLKNNGFINDLNFTKAYIFDKFNLSNDGPLKIKKELLEHNINEDIIDKYLSELKYKDIKNKLEKYVNKKVKLDHKHSINMIKNKLRIDLYNLGYENGMIEEVLNNIKCNDNFIKEYNLIYNKLSKKYEVIELNNKLKQKLYQKGYSLEEINSKIKDL